MMCTYFSCYVFSAFNFNNGVGKKFVRALKEISFRPKYGVASDKKEAEKQAIRG